MPSRGTTLRPIRVPEELYEQILSEIRRTNPNRADEEFNFSSWMLTAAREKLDLAWRRRTSRNRRKRLKGALVKESAPQQQPEAVEHDEPVPVVQEEAKQEKRDRKKGKKGSQPVTTIEQIPGFDESAKQLGYEPVGPGWEVTESVQTAEELQAEKDRDDRRI